MITRREVFTDLIQIIFGSSNIRFFASDYPKEYISRDGNQVSEAKYNKNDWQKFSEIIIAAYNGINIYKSSTRRNEDVMPYHTLIDNSITYFKSLIPYLDEKLLATIPIDVLGNHFSHSITEIIFPFVFDGDDVDKNAESEFKQIKLDLRMYFTKVETGCIVGKYAKAKDFPSFFDIQYKSAIEAGNTNDCYAVIIDRAQVESKIMVSFPIVSISLGITDKDGTDEYSLESIKGNYLKYPFEDNAPFIEPFAWYAEDCAAKSPKYSSDGYFTLSDKTIPRQYFVPRYYYFITKINQGTVDAYNNQVKNSLEKPIVLSDGSEIPKSKDFVDTEYMCRRLDHRKLNDILVEKSVASFRIEHYSEISTYYCYVIGYIEDMIIRIATANYDAIIRHNYDDVEACQCFTEHFNIEYGRIIEFIDEDPVKVCYECIEKAIIKFISYLDSFLDQLTDDFEYFIPDRAKEHYNSMSNYINQGNLTSKLKLASDVGYSESATNKEGIPEKNKNGNFSIFDTFKMLDNCQKKETTFERIYRVLNEYLERLKTKLKI